MTEKKTLKEIKADMRARGWIFENFPTGDGYECELSGPGKDMLNGLRVAPMVSDEGATEEDAIWAAYKIGLRSLPSGGAP